MEVTLGGEAVALEGKADYSLWYGSYSRITEAKRIGQFRGSCATQSLYG